MNDLALIFVPQWSAFQPPLSLPALAAWLRRAGYCVSVFDANVALYEWLFSESCQQLLSTRLSDADMSLEDRHTFGLLLKSRRDFQLALHELQFKSPSNLDDETLLITQKRAIRSLETWLGLVSRLSNEFTITPYNFDLKSRSYDEAGLDSAILNESVILRAFVEEIIDRTDFRSAKCVGISCIGQEQLYFTLLFCSVLRSRINIPIIIGGTILTRIFERGKFPSSWFNRYFDIVVKNEGEVPCSAILENLRAGRPISEGVPGILFLNGDEIQSTASPAALKPRDIPTPDFDGMPLDSYLSPSLTLPILSARGCYWGKCEFCHHGMVYGEKYASYDVLHLLESIRSLSARYGVRHFAFNDEALPPKVARQMGVQFPPHNETKWTFTALYKFEKFYTPEDFQNLHRVGLRSLYVGMESASERVLSLMRKPNSQEVVLRNLRDAHKAGIWTHCFLFFGFPGETETDARETFDFVFNNEEVIASVGCGTFSLEHNAPIAKHLDDFGIKLRQENVNDLSVYYSYDVSTGVEEDLASSLTNQFNDRLYRIPKYLSVAWIPRDQLLLFLSRMTPSRLVESSIRQLIGVDTLSISNLTQIFTAIWPEESSDNVVLVIDRLTGRVLRLKGKAATLFGSLYDGKVNLDQIKYQFPRMYAALFPASTSKPQPLEIGQAAA